MNEKIKSGNGSAVPSSNLLGQNVYLLIEHGDGEDPARIHICKTEQERREKTGLAIFGDQVNADLHTSELESDIETLEQNGRLDFEGDPSLEWINGYLA